MSILNVRGSDGKFQPIEVLQGPPGKTPVKGTDYWTDADKAEIVEEVKSSMDYMYFNSIAELKASTNLKSGTTVVTSGYHTAGDGGGGTYFISEKSESDEDDGGFVHVIGNLTAKLILDNQTVNILQMGITQNMDSITTYAQRAMDYLYANGGGVLYFPDGTYNFKTRLEPKHSVHIIGRSMEKTILRTNTTDKISLIYRLDTNDPLTDFVCENLTIDCESVTGDYTPLAKAFYIQGIRRSRFENLLLKNTMGTALGIDYLCDVTITKVFCDNCGRGFVANSGTIGASGIGIGMGCYEDENFTITDCVCVNSGQFGIFVEAQTDTLSEGCIISNNVCRNGRYIGIGVRGGNCIKTVTVADNQVYENADTGIYIDGGSNITVSGNIIRSNGNGIKALNMSSINNVLISGNLITDENYAVTLENYYESAGKTLSNVTIHGNTVINCKRFVRLFGLINGVTVSGNTTKGVTIYDLEFRKYTGSDSFEFPTVIGNNFSNTYGLMWAESDMSFTDKYIDKNEFVLRYGKQNGDAVDRFAQNMKLGPDGVLASGSGYLTDYVKVFGHSSVVIVPTSTLKGRWATYKRDKTTMSQIQSSYLSTTDSITINLTDDDYYLLIWSESTMNLNVLLK